MEKEIKTMDIPKGWEFDRIEDGKVILKETQNPLALLPKSWEDYCKIAEPDALFSKTKNGKVLTLMDQLLTLRDVYRQGWKPDWRNPENKWCVELYNDSAIKTIRTTDNEIFSFQSIIIRDLFYMNFKSELEKLSAIF